MAQLRPVLFGITFLLSVGFFVGCSPTQQTSSKPDGPVVSTPHSASEPTPDESSGPLSDQDALAALTAKGAIVKKDDDSHVVSVALVSTASSTVTDADLAELWNLADLEILNLMGCDQVTDDGIAGLRELSGLKSLFLGAGITNEGLGHVEALTSLETLSLSGCENVTDDGLARLTGLIGLKALMLGGTGITDDGIQYLTIFTKLERVGLGDTKITDDGVAKLKEALPGCQILGK